MENIIIGKDDIQIKNSYCIIHRKEMRRILLLLKEKYPQHPIFKWSNYLLISEWCSHNILYYLGIKKARTKDVDFNSNKSKWERFAYSLLACIYWL